MSTVATIEEKKISNTAAREGILAFEKRLKSLPHAVLGDSELCPLNHSFSTGIYIRDMQIAPGMQIVGEIHRHDHPVFLMEGEILVATEEGVVHLKAPQYFISPPGVKRAAITLTETVWVTVHHNPTEERDLKKIRENIISKDFVAFDKYAAKLAWEKKPFKEKLLSIFKTIFN